MADRVVQLTFTGPKDTRLDKYLVNQLPEHSRSRLQALIRDGFVTVNDLVVVKPGTEMEPGQSIQLRIPPPEPSTIVPQEIPMHVVYEDQNIIVINKPAGIVVHPAAGHATGTLVNAAMAHAPEIEGIGGELRPGVVHRLDKDTSGILIMAKNDRALRWLQDQFRDRKVKKIYLALVDGKPPTPQGRIEAAIGRDPSHRKQMAIVSAEKGRSAVSEYHTLSTYPAHTLLEVHPLSGRTHQIRLHLALIGCPIVGDTVYGKKKPSIPIGRHFLHAGQLTIVLLGESSPITFSAPLPDDLQQVLSDLS